MLAEEPLFGAPFLSAIERGRSGADREAITLISSNQRAARSARKVAAGQHFACWGRQLRFASVRPLVTGCARG
jgi:hypothetical protein